MKLILKSFLLFYEIIKICVCNKLIYCQLLYYLLTRGSNEISRDVLESANYKKKNFKFVFKERKHNLINHIAGVYYILLSLINSPDTQVIKIKEKFNCLSLEDGI